MELAATMTSKGQITLPKEVRRLLKVGTGSVIKARNQHKKEGKIPWSWRACRKTQF